MLRIKLVGADRSPRIEGLDPLAGRTNYFVGKDPKNWHTDIPTYSRVRYRNVYPGIDLAYHGSNQRQLEYDFVIAPGADPSRIRLNFDGAKSLRTDEHGDLIVATGGGELVEHRPAIYQDIQGIKKEIAGGYVVKDKRTVAFKLAAYDKRRTLVVDPTLVYSTYLGGSGDDYANGIAVDSLGSAYVTGATTSANFPATAGTYQPTARGGNDAFVTKLSGDGKTLIYSTYLGGSSDDYGSRILVDASGDAYVGGETFSSDFPTTAGASQTIFGGVRDAFVTKLNPSGNGLIYSTYLGGSGDDGHGDITIDSLGNVFVTGITYSSDFPTTPGAFQTTYGGSGDAYVTKLDPTGSTRIYSTYLGGSGQDTGTNVSVDPAGNAYVTGVVIGGGGFPTTAGALRTSYNGAFEDAFVTKLDPNGAHLVYSTYLGGTNQSNTGLGIGVDSSGDAYVTGQTFASDFPTTSGAFQPTLKACGPCGNSNGFVAKLNPAGSGLIYGTYLGGSGSEQPLALLLDAAGDAYVTGHTSSSDYPVTSGASQSTYGGGANDAFVSKLNPGGTALLYSTFLAEVATTMGKELRSTEPAVSMSRG